MAINVVKNQPIKLRTAGTDGFNDGICSKTHLDYNLCFECDDTPQLQVKGEAIGSNLVDDSTNDFATINNINTTPITAFELNDSTNPFGSVQVGQRISNNTDITVAKVTVVNSVSKLTLDTDIFLAISKTYTLSWWFQEFNTGSWLTSGGLITASVPSTGTTDMWQDILTVGKFYRLKFDLIDVNAITATVKIYLGDQTRPSRRKSCQRGRGGAGKRRGSRSCLTHSREPLRLSRM